MIRNERADGDAPTQLVARRGLALRRLSSVGLACYATTVFGCNDSAQRIRELNAEADKIATAWAPELESTREELSQLNQRLVALGEDGDAELRSLLANATTQLEAARSSLGELPSKVQEATTAGTLRELPDEFAAVSSSVSTTVNALDVRLGTAKKKLQELEAEAQVAAAAPSFEHTLASGRVLVGKPGGLEAQLVAVLASTRRPSDSPRWIALDQVKFAQDSAQLEPEASRRQLENIAALLATYPRLELEFSSRGDNPDQAADPKLAVARSENVVRALESLGASSGRLSVSVRGQKAADCSKKTTEDTSPCVSDAARVSVRVVHR